MWPVQAMKYSALKRKGVLTHATAWMNLENIVTQEDKHGVTPLL